VGQYLPIVVMIVLAILFAAISLVSSRLLFPSRPTRPSRRRTSAASSTRNEPPERFPVRFYLVAMIFIVFDIEIIFLYPYATIYHSLGTFGLIEVVVFSIAVFASFLYLIANGALDWGPPSRPAAGELGVSPNRTTASTILRVGGRRPRDPGAPHTPAEEAA
jgi:NADH-quinone oxidoreductase subunit A